MPIDRRRRTTARRGSRRSVIAAVRWRVEVLQRHNHRLEKVNIACVLKQARCAKMIERSVLGGNEVSRHEGKLPVLSWLACVVIYSVVRQSASTGAEQRRLRMAVRAGLTTGAKSTRSKRVDGIAVGDARRLAAVVKRVEEETMLWQDFLRAYRTVVDQLSEQMQRDHNLPLEWFDVLIHLADVPDGRLRQRALRDRLLLSESGVSRLLLRMEQAGLINRVTADDDKRGIEITLTPQGCSAVIEATASHLQMVSALFTQRLTPTDLNALTRVLPKLALAPDNPPSTPTGSR